MEESKSLALKLTLEKLVQQFSGRTMLTVEETAQAYGFKNPQSIYNALRKNASNPFPLRPVKRCGRWYWNIVLIAKDMIGE